MDKSIVILSLVILLISNSSVAQSDSIMNKMFREIASFTPDTTMPPPGKKSVLASRLLSYTGILNIDEAIDFKIFESRQKKERPENEISAASEFFNTGKGRRLLNNAMINIYTESFTEVELKRLTKFFKKNTGKKFLRTFPMIMIKGLMAAEYVAKAGGVKL